MAKKKKETKEKNKITKLELSLKKIEKMFGEGVISSAEINYKKEIPIISTGLLSLDVALGVMGLPKGRIIEVAGGDAAGKTSLVFQIIKSCQKNSGKCAYVDAEFSMDENYAKKSGVNLKELLKIKPKNGEEALATAEILIESGEVDLLIIDSVASLSPQAELEGEMVDATIGLQARLISKALRKMTGIISETNTTVIFVNQQREKIGSFGFGPKTTTPGGRALKHFKSIAISMQYMGRLKKGEKVIGVKTRATISKNKVAPPFKSTELKIYFDKGMSPEADIIMIGLKLNIIQKKGTWVYFDDFPLGQGLDDARKKLEEDEKLTKKLTDLILKIIKENNEM